MMPPNEITPEIYDMLCELVRLEQEQVDIDREYQELLREYGEDVCGKR